MLMGSAHPSCCLGAIFGGKCCHTPAHSSSNGVSSGTLWTGQPQRSQLKPRRNTTCAPSPCRFSNQAPSSGCNTCVQSVGTRSQKWWSARLTGAAMVSRQREVTCSSATAASCAISFPLPLRRENTPFRRPSCQAREEKRKFSPTATAYGSAVKEVARELLSSARSPKKMAAEGTSSTTG